MKQECLTLLLARIAEGDEQAFASFYTALEPRVQSFIASKSADPFEVADILNETFCEVWRSAHKFEGRSKPSTWVFSIAYYKTIDHFRKKKPGAMEDIDDVEIVDEAADQAAVLAALEEGDHLHVCLSKLKPAFRAVIELAFFEDMPCKEIAEIVSCPEGTVRSRIYHAKEALRHCLAKRMGDV